MHTVVPPVVRTYASSGAALGTYSGHYGAGPVTPAASCLNCGDERIAAFCANCGQERAALRTGLGQMAHEFIEEHFGFDSKFLRTLGPLLTRPGWLTRQYLIGRRARYVRPLKLYLLLSVVYFLMLTLHGKHQAARAARHAVPAATVATAATGEGTRSASSFASLRGRLREPAVAQRVYGELLPKTMLLLVPVLALLLSSAYRHRGWFFADHLIFSLHLHAFACVLGLVTLMLPSAWQFPVGTLGLGSYQLAAMQTVYRATWWSTFWKNGAVMLMYGIVAFFATIVSVMVGVYE